MPRKPSDTVKATKVEVPKVAEQAVAAKSVPELSAIVAELARMLGLE